ncbi:MAG: tight adherence protein C [Myxococcota bacterium]|jgi:tight adherence protein C
MTSSMAAIIVFFVIVVVGAGAYMTIAFMRPQRSAIDRIAEFTGGPAESSTSDAVAERIAERLARLARPESEEGRNILRQKLIQAGFKTRAAPQVFSAIRVALALLAPLAMVPFVTTLDPIYLGAGAIIAVAVGYYFPQLYVDSLVTNRKRRLSKPLPDALDLLVTTVEAGLGLDAAFRRVASELESAAPELALEFQLVNHEISAGVPRIEALKHLETRTGVPEIRSLVNMLTQAERFGTSIARSLRIHSDITRQKRMSRAEEEAAKVSPKLTVVMILFLMPCLFVVLLGPALVNISNSTLLD